MVWANVWDTWKESTEQFSRFTRNSGLGSICQTPNGLFDRLWDIEFIVAHTHHFDVTHKMSQIYSFVLLIHFHSFYSQFQLCRTPIGFRPILFCSCHTIPDKQAVYFAWVLFCFVWWLLQLPHSLSSALNCVRCEFIRVFLQPSVSIFFT